MKIQLSYDYYHSDLLYFKICIQSESMSYMTNTNKSRVILFVVDFNLEVIVTWLLMSTLTLWVHILIRRGVLDTTFCDKVCQVLAEICGVVFPGYSCFFHHHDITEILLKVVLTTITLTLLMSNHGGKIVSMIVWT